MKNSKTFNIEKTNKTKLLERAKLEPTGTINVSAVPYSDTSYSTMPIRDLQYTLEFDEHSKADKKIIKEILEFKLKNK
ncbi:MAG: hypothetical protein LBB39_02085 [Mycoplasmataceae bacterium]|jgi:hypothetical protein|nr:hypothetical protein [Mycoplasmataceae bacterium]